MPTGTTVNGAAFGQAYGGELSDWVNLGTGATETLTENVAPAITSADVGHLDRGRPVQLHRDHHRRPGPGLTEIRERCPAGITFTDNGNGTATIAGHRRGRHRGQLPDHDHRHQQRRDGATQTFTLTDAEAPAITSASTATFSTGVAGTYTVTTTGYPAATITESGTLPDRADLHRQRRRHRPPSPAPRPPGPPAPTRSPSRPPTPRAARPP